MLNRVAIVRTDFYEEHIASFIRVTKIVEVGTTLAVTNYRSTLNDGSDKFLRKAGSYKSHMA
jgi:hypothetical protein